jgi:hypothetical protein
LFEKDRPLASPTERVISQATAWQLTQMMEQTVTEGTARRIFRERGPRCEEAHSGERESRAGRRPEMRAWNERVIFAPFKVGIRQPDGGWRVVQPKPSLRPAPWQAHILLTIALSTLIVAPVAWLFARSAGSRFVVRIEDLDAVRLVGAGETPHPLSAEEVAESLTLLRIPADLAPGRYALRGVGTTETMMEITDVAMPAVGALRSHGLHRERARASASGLGGVHDGTERLVLRLAGTVPVDGLVIAEWTEDGAPESTWGSIQREVSPQPTVAPARYLASLASVGRCAGHGRFPPPGASVTFRYLDALGQLGPVSRPTRVPR